MHTDTPTIRSRVVPRWPTTREVRLVRPAERPAWLDGGPPLLGLSGLGGGIPRVRGLRRHGRGRLNGARARPGDRVEPPQQRARLKFVANNAQFLILPDIHILNLASATLAQNTWRLRADGTAVYGHPVRVAETFVDPTRFAGTSYRVGWDDLSQTHGFARQHQHDVRHGGPKHVWVRPLTPTAPGPVPHARPDGRHPDDARRQHLEWDRSRRGPRPLGRPARPVPPAGDPPPPRPASPARLGIRPGPRI